jgi:hypothetical protein
MKWSSLSLISLLASPVEAHECWIKRAVATKHGVEIYLDAALLYLKCFAKYEDISGSDPSIGVVTGGTGRTIVIPLGCAVVIGKNYSESCPIYLDRQKGVLGVSYELALPPPPVPMPNWPPPTRGFIPAGRR